MVVHTPRVATRDAKGLSVRIPAVSGGHATICGREKTGEGNSWMEDFGSPPPLRMAPRKEKAYGGVKNHHPVKKLRRLRYPPGEALVIIGTPVIS